MSYEYEMYTEEGNRVLGQAVDSLIESAKAGQFPATELMTKVTELLVAVEATGHGECYDTEPEWAVVDEINERLCIPMRWAPITRDF